MKSTSILIVEDEAVVALDLKMEVEALGYSVVGIADTADQAIALARQHRPGLALMDIRLRGDLDGIDAARSLRENPGTPVVFLTSFSDAETVQRAARTAPYGYLTKPFQVKELRASLEVALWKSHLERQLRESDRWFALTLRCVQDGVIVVNAQGLIRFVNPAGEELVGHRAEAVSGRSVADVIKFDEPGDGASTLVLSALQERSVMGVRHARRLQRSDGTTILVDESAAPIDDDQGVGLGAVLVMRDASDRVHQEALLRASEERFRNAFELAPLGMALVGLDGRFLQVNEALCTLLSSDPQWLRQQTLRTITYDADVQHAQGRLGELKTGLAAVTQFEARLIRRNGTTVWVLVSASLLTEPGGQPCHLFQVHDLTAQKEAAANLAELAAERMKREASELATRDRNTFLSRVSHEMRTPLNAVLGFAQLLRMHETGAQPGAAPYAEHILNAGRHLLTLVDDVLDLQRAMDGTLTISLERVALDGHVPDSMELLVPMATDRGVELSWTVEPGLHITADATRLRQVLLNLGSNAVKYNLQGGSVRVRAHRVSPARVRIVVEDTGIGMTSEQLAHLFEPFNRLGREQLRIPGVGLGLVITRELVQRMGGCIRASAGAPHGTRFDIEFDESRA